MNELPPPIGIPRELVEDRVRLATIKRDGLNQFVSASIGQRSQFLRDTLGISITALVGGVTLYFVSSDKALIKSKWLFLSFTWDYCNRHPRQSLG